MDTLLALGRFLSCRKRKGCSDVKGETVLFIYGWLYAKVCPLSYLKAQFFKNKVSFKHTIYSRDFLSKIDIYAIQSVEKTI